MKLARPDLRHPRIVFAGSPAQVGGDRDDEGLVAALRARGLHARWLAWDDPAAEEADLVILRDTGDYADRLDAFLAWTRRVPNLLNAPDVVAWNSAARHLADLRAAGVPILSDAHFAAGESVRVPAGEVVARPALGAESSGSMPVRRFVGGQTALVFLAGAQSHAFTAAPPSTPTGGGPILDETGPQPGDLAGPVEPDFEVWDVGYRTLAAAAEHLGIAPEDFLYARVDVTGGRDDPVLVELDLVAPSLGWRQLPEESRADAQRRFALALESALERLGLGPL